MPSKYSDVDSNVLCEWYSDGDEGAFNELHVRHNPEVMQRLHRLNKHDKQELNDVAQEIWSTAARYIKESFKGDAKFTTYLYTIIHTRCINYFRYKQSEWLEDSQIKLYEHFMYGNSGGGETDYTDKAFCPSSAQTISELRNMVELGDPNKYDELTMTHHLITEQVLSEVPEHEKIIFECRNNPDTNLKEASERTGIPFWQVKVISADICKQIETTIQERFDEFTSHYY